jgi:hypothetical protein
MLVVCTWGTNTRTKTSTTRQCDRALGAPRPPRAAGRRHPRRGALFPQMLIGLLIWRVVWRIKSPRSTTPAARSRALPSALWLSSLLRARKVLGRPKSCKLAQKLQVAQKLQANNAIWSMHSGVNAAIKRLKLAQHLGQLGVFLCATLIEHRGLSLVGSIEAAWWS